MNELVSLARARSEDRPAMAGVDWNRVADERATIPWVNSAGPRHQAALDYENGHLMDVVNAWRAAPWSPVNSGELVELGESLADAGDDAAAAFAEQLRPLRPIDADAIEARLQFRRNHHAASAALLQRVFVAARHEPWASVDLLGRSLDVAVILSKQRPYAAPLFRALEQPFAAGQWNDVRRQERALIGADMEGCGPHTIAALRTLEPWPVWEEPLLRQRAKCYGTREAREDLEEFTNSEPEALRR
jgi:hypothetical protein